MATAKNAAGTIVSECIEAINHENFNRARMFIADDIQFKGVLGSRNGADEYFADMEKMKLKYVVHKVIADNDDVCVFYDLAIAGATIFGCGWYHVKDGKITSLRVVFDPRPVIAASLNN